MAEVNLSRIFIRRGLDSQRLSTVLCEGELGYEVNTDRVFVGDSVKAGGHPVGQKTFISSSFTFSTTDLTAASALGLAYDGDIAVNSVSSFALSNINTNIVKGSTEDVVYNPSNKFMLCRMLTATDDSDPAGAANTSTNWVPLNSAIPYPYLDIPNNIIPGEKIHGGDISGNITFSGTVSTGYLSSNHTVMTSGVSATALAGNAVRRLYVTTTGAISSDNLEKETIISLGTPLSGYGTSSGSAVGQYNVATAPTLTNSVGGIGSIFTMVLPANFTQSYTYDTLDFTVLYTDLQLTNYSFQDIKGFHVMFQGHSQEGPASGTVFGFKNNTSGEYIACFGKPNSDNPNWYMHNAYIPNLGASDRIVIRLAGCNSWKGSFYLYAVSV